MANSGKSSDSIRIPNLRQIQNALVELGVSKQELGEASFQAGMITAVKAKDLVPKKSGKLATTIKARRMASKVMVVAGNNTTVKYAGLQNFGSKRKNVEGAYFFQMAIRRTRQQVLDTYLDTLQAMVDKAERKANK